MRLGDMDAAVLDRIPLTARSVLLVGCDALGAAYTRRNPAARVMFGAPDTAFASGIDCIVYGDSLSREPDPAALLRRDVESLAESGVVLVAVANAEYWRQVDNILRGCAGFEGGFGLLPNAVEQALHRAGLQIVDVTPLDSDPDGAEMFADVLTRSLRRLGVNPDEYARRAAPRRFIWRARRQPRQSLSLVSTMLNPVGGVSHVRVTEPMRALASDPDAVPVIVSNVDPPPPGMAEPRIFIFHRPLLIGEEGLARVRALLDDNWLVVCEFDDHPDYLAVLRQPDVQNFRAMHALQTSTEPLAAVLRQHNPEVAVFPNAIADLPDIVNYTDPNTLTLICAGLNREEESPPYVDVFNAVAALAGPRLRFRIVGDFPLFEALQTPHKAYTPVCDYDTYRALLSRSEICFMPLRDTPFNRCKSDLKFIEAAAHRVTSLASDVVYRDSIDNRRTGLIFASPDELRHNLLHLLANPDFGRQMADNARAHVAQHRMLADQVAARMAWYRSLWARRDALCRALLQRSPELRA